MAGAPSEEPRLIARARAGDADAFAALVLAHSGHVRAVLRQAGLGPAEAEDVMQEVFLRAWRALPAFAERARLSTWLHRIAINEARRFLARRRRTEVSEPGGWEEIETAAVAKALGRSRREPEDHVLVRELDDVLRRALAELPPLARDAVVLRDVEGLSIEDAATISRVPPAAFKSRLHRGRALLRSRLAPYLGT